MKLQLEEFQKQLGKKQKFEDAVSSIKSLLREFYPSASPSLRKSVSIFFFYNWNRLLLFVNGRVLCNENFELAVLFCYLSSSHDSKDEIYSAWFLACRVRAVWASWMLGFWFFWEGAFEELHCSSQRTVAFDGKSTRCIPKFISWRLNSV